MNPSQAVLPLWIFRPGLPSSTNLNTCYDVLAPNTSNLAQKMAELNKKALFSPISKITLRAKIATLWARGNTDPK